MKNQHSASLQQLARTLLWCFTWDDENHYKDYSINQIDSACLVKLESEFQQFVASAIAAVKDKRGYCADLSRYFLGMSSLRSFQLEHDYILTRNHHGAGFWDGDWDKSVGEIFTTAAHLHPEIEAYVGDDNLIYF
jgi:hypothetical protein